MNIQRRVSWLLTARQEVLMLASEVFRKERRVPAARQANKVIQSYTMPARCAVSMAGVPFLLLEVKR